MGGVRVTPSEEQQAITEHAELDAAAAAERPVDWQDLRETVTLPAGALDAARALRYGEPTDTYTWEYVAEAALLAAAPLIRADERKRLAGEGAHSEAASKLRTALAYVPAQDCCPAEAVTFKGVALECESDPGHGGMHRDIDQAIWWFHDDELDALARAARPQDMRIGAGDVLEIISGEEAEVAPDVGHISAADASMIAKATGGGIRSREVQPEFAVEEDPRA
jgi:hypothetical protein